jgi:hypothetical protein
VFAIVRIPQLGDLVRHSVLLPSKRFARQYTIPIHLSRSILPHAVQFFRASSRLRVGAGKKALSKAELDFIQLLSIASRLTQAREQSTWDFYRVSLGAGREKTRAAPKALAHDGNGIGEGGGGLGVPGGLAYR